jgi:DNA-binding LacI/PurR family transcriptional regulator
MPRRPTMRDIARAAGVPLSAVPLVLGNRPGVADERRQRVLAAVETLGYAPSARARRPRRIGLVIEALRVPVLTDIFYGEVIAGIQAEAQRQGCSVWLQLFDETVQRIEAITQTARDECDGLILANGGELTDARIDLLAASGIPLVLVDNHVLGRELHCVLVDNLGAGYIATRHLVDLGHRRIAMLTGPRRYRNLVDRLDGYLDALAEAGLPADPCLMPPPPTHEERKGEAQTQALLALRDPPTAILAVSDKTAFGALGVLQRMGVRVPEDVSLTSIDDVVDAATTVPALTTVAVPKGEMGALAVRRLLALLDEPAAPPQKSVLYTRLVERASTARPGGEA